jgi:hypothetical protein
VLEFGLNAYCVGDMRLCVSRWVMSCLLMIVSNILAMMGSNEKCCSVICRLCFGVHHGCLRAFGVVLCSSIVCCIVVRVLWKCWAVVVYGFVSSCFAMMSSLWCLGECREDMVNQGFGVLVLWVVSCWCCDCSV